MSQYKTVECYKTFDGKLFEDEQQAKAHADDILGEELDGLLKLANARENQAACGESFT